VTPAILPEVDPLPLQRVNFGVTPKTRPLRESGGRTVRRRCKREPSRGIRRGPGKLREYSMMEMACEPVRKDRSQPTKFRLPGDIVRNGPVSSVTLAFETHASMAKDGENTNK